MTKRHNALNGWTCKLVTLVGAVLLVGTSGTLGAQTTTSIRVLPSSPTAEDIVTARVGGQWPDSCTPATANRTNLVRQGNHLSILFDPPGGSVVCATVITPWTLDVNLGVLSAGSYQLDASLTRSLIPPQLLAATSFVVSAPEKSLVYVPGFLSRGTVTLGSRLTVYNNGSSSALVEPVAAYDAEGRRDLTGAAPINLAPGASAPVETSDLRSGSSLQIVALRTPSRVAFRPVLERSIRVDSQSVPQGRLPLPVFRDLVPAGIIAVSGDVKVFDAGSRFSCSEKPARLRRVNLTLFNAGTTPALFRVEVEQADSASGPHRILSTSYEIAAESTRQFNSVIPPSSLCEIGPAGSVWFRISSDQPSLSYVSTVFDEPEAGAIAYEIYPARIQD